MSKSTENRARTAPRPGNNDGKRPGAIGIAAIVAAIGGIAYGLARLRRTPRGGEHPAPDLTPDAPRPGTDRAPVDFRPDPTAPVPAAERESLRPATGPAPKLAADRTTIAIQTAPA